jgi:hypothetical protein
MAELAPLPLGIEPYKINDNRVGLNGSTYGNKQWIYRFANGFGASVVQGPYSYGGDQGLYEIAVIKFECPSGVWAGDDTWDLTYQTPITSDVLGYLAIDEVASTLVAIARLTTMGEITDGV